MRCGKCSTLLHVPACATWTSLLETRRHGKTIHYCNTKASSDTQAQALAYRTRKTTCRTLDCCYTQAPDPNTLNPHSNTQSLNPLQMRGRGRPAIHFKAMDGILAAAGVGFCEAGRGRFSQQDERMGDLHLHVYRPSRCTLSSWPMRCRRAGLCTGRWRRARRPGYPPPQPLLQVRNCQPEQREVPINVMAMVLYTIFIFDQVPSRPPAWMWPAPHACFRQMPALTTRANKEHPRMAVRDEVPIDRRSCRAAAPAWRPRRGPG